VLGLSQLNFSARAYHRTQSVKLARTIADLARSEHIQTSHVAEALQYRPKCIKRGKPNTLNGTSRTG
jgi:predicted ATPase with chaperone activity